MSSYYQGTPYNPLSNIDNPKKGIYRPIGISRTGVMAVLQIRPYMPKLLKGVEWICFGANPYNAICPVYTSVKQIPKYFSDVTLDVSTNNFYWNSRLIGALADEEFGYCVQHIERYQMAVSSRGHEILNKYDAKMIKSKSYKLLDEANEELANMAKEETTKALNNILKTVSEHMRVGYSRADK